MRLRLRGGQELGADPSGSPGPTPVLSAVDLQQLCQGAPPLSRQLLPFTSLGVLTF